MVSFEEIEEDLEKKVKEVKTFVEELPLQPEQKSELYIAIRKNQVMISPMPINRVKMDRLNELVKISRDAYQDALDYAETLPATNDCYLYAKQEIRVIWNILD